MTPAFVVGLRAEARIAGTLGWPVGVGGGTPQGAASVAARLVDAGATGLVSFGFAGGLDHALRPGQVIVPETVLLDGETRRCDTALARIFGGPTRHMLLGGSAVAADAAAKQALRQFGAQAIDLESRGVVRVALQRGVPFAVVRAICDPAERTLPPAALFALDTNGTIGISRVIGSLLHQPAQVPDLLRLARDAAAARKGLIATIQHARAALIEA
jgi:adenosylhomocysteine nucleosidase